MTEAQTADVQCGDHKIKVANPDGTEKIIDPKDVQEPARETRPHRMAASEINLDFGCALEALRHGKVIFRKGWNCEGAGNHCVVYLIRQTAPELPQPLDVLVLEKPDKSLSQWHPSVPDVLAMDWCFENPTLLTGESDERKDFV